MATTARAVPGLDVSTSDAMDLHSDSGYDFGDGDIELDLDPVGSVIPDDDDLSIQDAGTDNGLDVQTASADHDDFMADNEDLIEEDMNNENNESSFNNQDSLRTSVSQQQSPAAPEEDLIDYSDDEGMQEHQDQETHSYHEGPVEESLVGNEEYAIPQSPRQDNAETLNVGNETQDQDYDQGQEQEEVQDQQQFDQDKPESNLQDQQQTTGTDWDRDHENFVQRNESYEAQDESNDEVTVLQEGNLYVDENEEHQNDEHHMDQLQVGDQASTEEDGHHQNDRGLALPPVTVNYSGNEYWLFKQHDADDSGDWLLEDLALADGEISHVFQACRTSLGQEITVETELGFRFDHMHNMELYEDNTVCAYVTLQRLVALYHTLLTQDDIAEPEPFYITLQFRPRFFTLLGEMETYAQAGNGFMKLNAAIAAGQTHFSNVFSAASTEAGYGQWENEGEEGEEENDNERVGDEKQHENQDNEQQDDEYEEEHEVDGDEEHEDETHEEPFDENQNEGTNFEPSASQEENEQRDTISSHPEITNNTSDTSHSMNNLQGTIESPTKDDSHSNHESASASGSHPDEGNDLIDYSDDEDAGHDDELEHNSHDEASTSSSTVQGEDSSHPAPDVVDGFANPADPTVSAEQSSHEDDDRDDEEDADDEDLSAQYADLDAPDPGYHGQNYGQEVYQGEDQTYNSPDQLEAYEPNENQEYSAQPDLEGDTNEYYGDPEDQNADEQIFSTLPVDAADDDATGAVDSTTVDGLVDVEDYLNVGDATLPGLDDNILSTFPDDSVEILDPSVEFPDQDGAVEQPVAKASPVAEPIATSSVELTGLSPQGQKRTIDEVGNEAGDASGSIDAKRPRV